MVRLDRMYALFTGLPGGRREYSLLEFGRDLHALRESGTREVREGARVSSRRPRARGARGA